MLMCIGDTFPYDYSPGVQYKDSVTVHDGVESVSNGEDRAGSKLGSDCSLD